MMDDICFGESNGIWFHTHVKGWEERNEDTISCHWSKNKSWQKYYNIQKDYALEIVLSQYL